MTRDRELVSDTERNRALMDIVENVRDCKIKLISSSQKNSVMDKGVEDNKQKYTITLSKPTVKGIEPFTALNHECWHILFESPIKILHSVMKEWATDNTVNWSLIIYYKYVMNLLEDQRIESLGSKLWLGTGKRIMKMREKRGVILQQEEEKLKRNPAFISPPDLLLMIRFLQGEKYRENKYYEDIKQALEDVELTGKYGVLRVMRKIKPILDEWWEDNIINDHKHFNGNKTKGNDMESWVGKEKNEVDGKEYATHSPDVEEDIKEEKEKGKEVIQEVNDKLNQNTPTQEDLSYVKYVDRPEAIIVYDDIISNHMRKLFKTISMLPREKINDQGNEIDIESFITNKIEKKNINRCLIDKRLNRGISLLLSIDVSSSMSYDNKIDITRKLVATLFKSVEGLDNIEIKAQTWSSDSVGKITIQEINSYKDVKSVNCGQGGETPTHLAIDYATRTARKMKGEKKLIIILTDGHPQYHKNNFQLPLRTLILMTKKSLVRAIRHTPNIMCIHVGSVLSLGLMRVIFGSRFMHTDGMNEASERIIKEFKSLVVRTMLK